MAKDATKGVFMVKEGRVCNYNHLFYAKIGDLLVFRILRNTALFVYSLFF